MLPDDCIRLWTSAPRAVSLAACDDWVVVTRSTPDTMGRRRVCRLHVMRDGHLEPVSPAGWDCWQPVVADAVHPVSTRALLCLTDQGAPARPVQVVERLPCGDWEVVTDAAGGVVAFHSGAHRVVALERVQASQAAWGAEVAVTEDHLVGHWDRWLTEDTLQLVVYDRLTGTRMPLGLPRPRLLENCAFAVSPGGRSLAHTQRRVGEDGVLERVLIVRSLPGHGTAHTLGERLCCDHSHPVFSPDGRQLAFVRHQRGASSHGRKQLWVADGTAGEQFPVASEYPHWIEPQLWTADGIVGLATIGDHRRVVRVDPSNDSVLELDDVGLDGLSLGSPSRSWHALAGGRRLVGLASSLHVPPHLCEVGGEALATAPAPVELPPMQSVMGPATAARRCPAMWLPTAAAGPRPLLLLVHGGPISAWRDEWHPRQAAARFASLDAHVLLANPRGSVGRGDAHVEGVWHHWGRAIDDLVELLQRAMRDPRVDPSRVAVFGGSFGGWAVNRLATRADAPDFCALVTHAGIFDHTSMYGACDEPGAWAWHVGGRPHLRSEHLLADEPARHVHQWRAPTLITHGACDHNVPVGQALQLHTALLDHGVDSRLVVFANEGHHILAPRNEVRWWSEVLRFLGHHFAASTPVQ